MEATQQNRQRDQSGRDTYQEQIDEREFGVGYGNSSGYASGKTYLNRSWRPSLFTMR